jgi:hypothetical protein
MVGFKGKYELADLKAAQNLHAMPGKWARVGLFALLGLFVLLLLAGSVLASMGGISWWLIIYPLFIVGFLLLYWFVLRPAQIARAYKLHKELSSPFEMKLTEEGYAIQNSYGQGKIPWKDFAKWKADKNMILLYRTDNMFNMIPRRLLQGNEETEYILDQLRQAGVKEASQVRNPGKTLSRALVWVLVLVIIGAFLYMNLK